jgi:hypothetical protein
MSQPSSIDIVQLVEFGEAYAWADHFFAAPDEFKSYLGLQVEDLGSAVVLVMSGLEEPFINRLIGLGINEPATERMLDDLLSYLQWAEIKQFMINLSPEAAPARLVQWIESRGFWQWNRWAKFYRGSEPAPIVPSTLRIEQTGSDFADAFAYVASQAFGVPDYFYPWMGAVVGRPGWHHYTAWDNDEPVATGALYIRGDVGWLGHGSTLASHRRRGAQAALLARRLQDGLELGCKWFVTETDEDTPENPNPSFRNIQRAGFKLAYLRPNYVWSEY